MCGGLSGLERCVYTAPAPVGCERITNKAQVSIKEREGGHAQARSPTGFNKPAVTVAASSAAQNQTEPDRVCQTQGTGLSWLR